MNETRTYLITDQGSGDTELVYTPQQAAQILGMTSRNLRKRAERRGIGYRPSPRMLLFTAEDIQALAKPLRSGPKSL